MRPTISYIQSRFDEYNYRFFGGSLPALPIKLSHAKGFLGKVTFTRRKHGLFSGDQNEDFVLRINVRIDLPEEVVEDTILHEMIHYYIAVNQWKDSSTHGVLFRREMQRINETGGRHITISHRLNEAQQAEAHVHKKRVVAVVRFAAPRRFAISQIEWYYTDNEYFAKYPSSIAMKIFLIKDPSELPLANAPRLNISR